MQRTEIVCLEGGGEEGERKRAEKGRGKKNRKTKWRDSKEKTPRLWIDSFNEKIKLRTLETSQVVEINKQIKRENKRISKWTAFFSNHRLVIQETRNLFLTRDSFMYN